ncbi:MAG: 3-phosphoshikimate 1-carboxyvinyltransferase [Oscillibacter sp.]|jgi:3-phosphoshikimate 1-carboxyvinyltransferase|nr:3-phosphoshikimate 1-carboxyvinyltransferase [Oscillibacter sp.]
MDIRITPGTLSGELRAIPSKSDAHRKLILAALGDCPTVLHLPKFSADIQATADCLAALGAKIDRRGQLVAVSPIQSVPENPLLDCGESGSTLRFLLPVAAALCGSARFTGRGRLPDRPIGELKSAMESHGVTFSAPKLPFTVSGKMTGGAFSLPGNVSSQYITGLLLALPLLGEDSVLTLTTPLQSAAYVDITLRALEQFQIQVDAQDGCYRIPGRQCCSSPGILNVEGDWSNAAFFLTAGALGAAVTLTDLDGTSPQGDKAIVNALRTFGADVQEADSAVTVSPAPLTGCTVDISGIPDALPILSVLAACAAGTTRFINAGRLRLKESDRLKTTAAMLTALGGNVEERPDELLIHGGTPLVGGTVDGANDHRIVMAAAIAAVRCAGSVTILGAEAVNKSYPSFFDDYCALGGIAHEL